MLDKTSDEDQQTGHCSDCGCSLPQPDSDSANTPAPPKQQRVDKAARTSKCPKCQAGSSLPNGRRPHRRLRLEPHSCSLCSKTFISSTHLAHHVASHTKERKFRCSICGKYFHQANHLMAHKIIHSGDRPFKCPECSKTFGRASHLKTHRRLHTGEKPFKCTYCDKSFTQKAGLLAHVRLHTGERPHKCEQCGESFCSLSLLLSHKAEESSGEAKPASAPALNQPQKTQSSTEDLNCDVCCRTFVRSSYIQLHIRLNKGQRPYHCKVCNTTFILPGVKVIIANTETKGPLGDSHLGEIWVSSPHNATGYYTVYGEEALHADHFNTKLSFGDTQTVWARTGYLGFLRRTDLTDASGERHDALYVVGSLDETLELRGISSGGRAFYT